MNEFNPDGGPAFPSHGSMGEVAHQGMTLRDYIAIHATDKDIEHYIDSGMARNRRNARYMFADSMLRAREAK